MKEPGGVFAVLKARGEEMLTQVSAQLMSNPRFMQAIQAATEGKQKLDQAVARVLKQMNIPSRSEFKKALARIEALEAALAELRALAERPRRPRARKGKPGA